MKFNRGFTLIELMVVVAIVGLLASIILASLNSARTKTKDNAVFSTARGVQAGAVLCLADGAVERLGFVGGSGISQWICRDAVIGPQIGGWPDIREYGWQRNFYWCDPREDLSYWSSSTVTYCGNYGVGGTCGGVSYSLDFCFFTSTEVEPKGGITTGKKVVCTEEGCLKIGF